MRIIILLTVIFTVSIISYKISEIKKKPLGGGRLYHQEIQDKIKDKGQVIIYY